MGVLVPNLGVLQPPQLRLWEELEGTPEHFTLYGGTAVALRLGHRSSVDFDFFSNEPFDPDRLAREVSYLEGAERVQVAPNTLTCRLERGGPVLVSFFGELGLGRAAPRDRVRGRGVHVASALDLLATKLAVVQKRAEAKDYFDIDALLQHGITLPEALVAARVVYGHSFNPLITLKALCYFDDLPALPAAVRQRLSAAAQAVDPASLPELLTRAGAAKREGSAS